MEGITDGGSTVSPSAELPEVEEDTFEEEEQEEQERTPWVVVTDDQVPRYFSGRYSNRWTSASFELGHWKLRDGVTKEEAEAVDGSNPELHPELYSWVPSFHFERSKIVTIIYARWVNEGVSLDEAMDELSENVQHLFPVEEEEDDFNPTPMDLGSLNERFKQFKKDHGMKKPDDVYMNDLSDLCWILGLAPSFKLTPIQEDDDAASE